MATRTNTVALQSSNAAATAPVGSNLLVNPFIRPKDGYLKAYLQQLQLHPLRTKMITSGTLQALQEYLASYLTGMKNKDGGYFTDRVWKMSLYGIFLQAPFNHVAVNSIQKLFAGQTGPAAKIQQIVLNNLTVVPIQILMVVIVQAIVRGAKTLDEVQRAAKAAFLPLYRFAAIFSPLAMLFAQNFLSAELWVPFFNFVAFALGTTFNVIAKRKALAASKAAETKKAE